MFLNMRVLEKNLHNEGGIFSMCPAKSSYDRVDDTNQWNHGLEWNGIGCDGVYIREKRNRNNRSHERLYKSIWMYCSINY